MRRRWIVLCAAGLTALAAFGLRGPGAFGHAAGKLGLHGIAAHLLDDPAARGAALYRAGRYQDAAESFANAGPDAAYNFGNAQAQLGNYAEALLAYDRVVLAEPDHGDARANFNLIASVYSGTALEFHSGMTLSREREGDTIAAPEAQGGTRATGQGDEASAATDFVKPELRTGREQRNVRQPFDDLFIAADTRWLTTLEDQPGKYLAARLKAEQEQRAASGRAAPPGDDPW